MSNEDKLPKDLMGDWVEIRERCQDGRLVLMRSDADIPPTRGGRRQLKISQDGTLGAMAQGASDRLEPTDTGVWQIQGDVLNFEMNGWEGQYEVDTMTDTELILRRR